MQQFSLTYLAEQGDELLRYLGDRKRELALTPLLLLMLCSLFKATGEVPLNRGSIIRQFAQSYARINQDVPVTDESWRWWLTLLQQLAFKMTQGRDKSELLVAIPRFEVEEIFTAFTQERGFDLPRDPILLG